MAFYNKHNRSMVGEDTDHGCKKYAVSGIKKMLR